MYKAKVEINEFLRQTQETKIKIELQVKNVA